MRRRFCVGGSRGRGRLPPRFGGRLHSDWSGRWGDSRRAHPNWEQHDRRKGRRFDLRQPWQFAFTTCIVGVALNPASAGSTVTLLYDGPGSYGLGFPTSATVLGTNGSGQVVGANTSGTGTTVALTISPVITHPLSGGSTPAVMGTNCGTTAPTFYAGTDSAGRLTLLQSLNSCTVNFASSWPNHPVCVAVDETSGHGIAVTTTTSTFQMSAATAFASGDSLAWLCVGY